jgi:hypothetical protein
MTFAASSALGPRVPEVVLRTHLNILLVGTTKQTSDFMAGLWPALLEPIVLCDAAGFLWPRESIGTLILENATEMAMAQQVSLFAQLEDSLRHTRVITTVRRPLFPDVQMGWFLHALYYRLNTIMLDFCEQAVQHSEYSDQPRSAHSS